MAMIIIQLGLTIGNTGFAFWQKDLGNYKTAIFSGFCAGFSFYAFLNSIKEFI